MKVLAFLICSSICSCQSIPQRPVEMPEKAPIDHLIDLCEVSGDTVVCPRKVFVTGMKSASQWIGAAESYAAQHEAVSGLLGLKKEDLQEQQARTEQEKRKKYYWLVGGYIGGILTFGIISLSI